MINLEKCFIDEVIGIKSTLSVNQKHQKHQEHQKKNQLVFLEDQIKKNSISFSDSLEFTIKIMQFSYW